MPSKPMSEQTWTLGALLDWTAKHLAQKGAEFPRLDAEVLLAHAAGCKRIDLYGLRFAEEAAPEVRQKYKELIRRRIEGCPVAYLVGKKEFHGLEFEVGPAVLIPRPDSEHVGLGTASGSRRRSGRLRCLRSAHRAGGRVLAAGRLSSGRNRSAAGKRSTRANRPARGVYVGAHHPRLFRSSPRTQGAARVR